MRVRRLATDAGESLLGRVLTPEQAHAFRDAFGLAGGPVMSSAEMHEAILTRGASFDLANGWRLARRRLMGAGASRSRGRPTATSRRSSAWAAPPRSSRGAPVCSCPNTSTSAASSNAGRSRLRTRCKPHAPARYPARGRPNACCRPLRALPGNCAFAPPTAANCTTCHMEGHCHAFHIPCPTIPSMRFVPAYDFDNVPQQIRIVFDSMPGLRPHGVGGAHTRRCLRICDRLNARLGRPKCLVRHRRPGHVRRPR